MMRPVVTQGIGRVAGRAVAALALVVAGVVAAACGEATAVGDTLPLEPDPRSPPAGLSQSVTVEPATVPPGGTITVRSVVRNTGVAPREVTATLCWMGLGGELRWSYPPGLARCAGYSTQLTLAPGDSLLGYERVRVDSPPGTYTLTVQHLLEPAAWATVQVQVRVLALP